MENNDDFLKNLKDAVDSGKFNSDAAKKINEIVEKSEEKKDLDSIHKKYFEKKADESEVQDVSDEEVSKLNSEYEIKMNKFKKQDEINKHLATLINIDDFVMNQLTELSNTIDMLRKKYEGNEEVWKSLFEKMSELENKYNLSNNVNKR